MISKTMLAAALTASAGLAACGSSGTSSSTPKPAPTSASGAAATTAATAAPAAAAAAPAGGAAITFAATEYAFVPTAVTAKAGKVRMTLENKGKIPHELILLKTSQAAGAMKIKSSTGKISESASVGEVSELAAGKSASHTFKLTPGKYVFVCNIPGHYKLGMRGVLTVR